MIIHIQVVVMAIVMTADIVINLIVVQLVQVILVVLVIMTQLLTLVQLIVLANVQRIVAVTRIVRCLVQLTVLEKVIVDVTSIAIRDVILIVVEKQVQVQDLVVVTR